MPPSGRRRRGTMNLESDIMDELKIHGGHLRRRRDERRTYCFSWGQNHNGQLGISPYANAPSAEKGLDLLGIQDCAAMTETVMAHHNRDLMCASVPRETWLPSKVTVDGEIVSMSTCFFHTLAADDEGTCYSWGGGENGVLGYGYEKHEQLVPRRIIKLPRCVVQVAAGKYHSLARTRDGHVYAWGSSKSGKLGFGDFARNNVPAFVSSPRKVPLRGNATYIAAATKSSYAIVSPSSSVYVWGSNVRHAQPTSARLPSSRSNRSPPTPHARVSSLRFTDRAQDSTILGHPNEMMPGKDVLAPRRSDTLSRPRPKALWCRFHHGVLLANDGHVYTFGSGTRCLGRRDTNTYVAPIASALVRPSEMDVESSYVHAAAGLTHSLAVDSNGRLYAWGKIETDAEFRVTGTAKSDAGTTMKEGDRSSMTSLPRTMDTFEVYDDVDGTLKTMTYSSRTAATRIVRVSAFTFHSIAVSVDQRVYAFGVDKLHRLGRHGDVKGRAHVPRQIRFRPDDGSTGSKTSTTTTHGAKTMREMYDCVGRDGSDDDDAPRSGMRRLRVSAIATGQMHSLVALTLSVAASPSNGATVAKRADEDVGLGLVDLAMSDDEDGGTADGAETRSDACCGSCCIIS